MREEHKKLQDIHERIREILINSGSKEYGDSIIDEICQVVDIQDTTVYYNED